MCHIMTNPRLAPGAGMVFIPYRAVSGTRRLALRYRLAMILRGCALLEQEARRILGLCFHLQPYSTGGSILWRMGTHAKCTD